MPAKMTEDESLQNFGKYPKVLYKWAAQYWRLPKIL